MHLDDVRGARLGGEVIRRLGDDRRDQSRRLHARERDVRRRGLALRDLGGRRVVDRTRSGPDRPATSRGSRCRPSRSARVELDVARAGRTRARSGRPVGRRRSISCWSRSISGAKSIRLSLAGIVGGDPRPPHPPASPLGADQVGPGDWSAALEDPAAPPRVGLRGRVHHVEPETPGSRRSSGAASRGVAPPETSDASAVVAGTASPRDLPVERSGGTLASRIGAVASAGCGRSVRDADRDRVHCGCACASDARRGRSRRRIDVDRHDRAMPRRPGLAQQPGAAAEIDGRPGRQRRRAHPGTGASSGAARRRTPRRGPAPARRIPLAAAIWSRAADEPPARGAARAGRARRAGSQRVSSAAGTRPAAARQLGRGPGCADDAGRLHADRLQEGDDGELRRDLGPGCRATVSPAGSRSLESMRWKSGWHGVSRRRPGSNLRSRRSDARRAAGSRTP